jgi:hypothetical protein
MELKTQIKKQHELSDIYSRLLNFRYGIENEEALRACDRIETELKSLSLQSTRRTIRNTGIQKRQDARTDAVRKPPTLPFFPCPEAKN